MLFFKYVKVLPSNIVGTWLNVDQIVPNICENKPSKMDDEINLRVIEGFVILYFMTNKEIEVIFTSPS